MSRSMGIQLDTRSGAALHRQIFDQIVARIESGTYPAGYRLLPTRELAVEVGVHRNTVVRAYADLESAGFVRSTVGRGTFVALPARAKVHEPPEASETTAPARGAGLPWSTLRSRAASAEPLNRAQRLSRAAPGREVVNLTRMQPSPDLVPDELLRRCADHVLRTQGARALGYAPPDGLPRLRELIAQDLSAQGVPATADDVLVTTGSQQGLDLIARALIDPGDVFLVDGTTYGGAINLLTVAGARLIPVPADEHGPDPAALERLRGLGAKGFYLMPNCHNPTGRRISAARRGALVAWSRSAGVPLIEDDYGADIQLSERRPPPALRALDVDVVYLGTFSKRLAPALRVGFVLCPPALRPMLSNLKHAMDLGTSVFLQHVLAEFLDRGYLRAHLRRTLPEYAARRDALDAALRAHVPPGVGWKRPESGVVLWLTLPRGVDPESAYDESLRRGVMVSPGTLNAVDAGEQHGVRLTFCAEPRERLVEGARRLGSALSAVMARQKRDEAAGRAAGLELV